MCLRLLSKISAFGGFPCEKNYIVGQEIKILKNNNFFNNIKNTQN